MAIESATEPPQPVPSADEPHARRSRGTRAQAVQRLQVGLFGLAAMVLLVGLANIVIEHARQQSEARGRARSGADGRADRAPSARRAIRWPTRAWCPTCRPSSPAPAQPSAAAASAGP